MKIQIPQARLKSLSEEESVRDRTARARNIKPPAWWIKYNLQQREKYLESHPNSRLKHILNVGLDAEGNPIVNPRDAQKASKQKDEAQKKAEERVKKRKEREEKEKEKAEKKHGAETTEEKTVRLDAALAQSSWRKGAAKLASKGTMFAGKLSRNLTPKHTTAVENFFKEKFAPKNDDDSDTGADTEVDTDTVIAAVKPLARVLLAGALVGLTLAGGGIIVGALASAYTNGGFTLPEFLSESGTELDTSDPIQFLVHDFTRWAKSVDMREVSGVIAEIIAVQKQLESAKGNTEGKMVSESASASLRFVPCPSHKKNNTPITRYLIKLGTKQVGRIHSDVKIPGDSPSNRCWVCTLNDGYSETAYRTGVSRQEPFTLATPVGVILRNPQRQTLDEAKSWIRATVNKALV